MGKKVTGAQAGKTIRLVAEWMRVHGMGGESGIVPTGPEAAAAGLGPQLVMDWDWTGTPTPTVILEGGLHDWAADCCFWVQERLNEANVPVFVEPYSGWALSMYRIDA